MWRWGVGMGGARLFIQLCGWQCVYWRQPSSKCMPWQAKLKSIIWIIHTRTQNKTQLSKLHYTPFSFFSSCLLAPWLSDLIFVCLIMTKLLTNIPVNPSVLGITDCQHFSLPNTSQHLILSAFLKFSLDPGDHSPICRTGFLFPPWASLLPPIP